MTQDIVGMIKDYERLAVSHGGVPRCGKCAKPAQWVRNIGAYGPFCKGNSCGNRERICGRCGAPFVMGVGAAGYKYCAQCCKHANSNPKQPEWVTVSCRRCGHRPDANKPAVRDSLWGYVCSGCRYPLRFVTETLRKHKVAWEQAETLLDNPLCQVCGVNILVPGGTGGGRRSALTVDHDHGCCNGPHSCGSCVRGFLCVTCNAGIGHFKNDLQLFAAAVDYLKAWHDRRL